MSILPQIVGATDIPLPTTKKPKPGKRGPGRWYLHGGEHSQFARQVLSSLQPGQALTLEFASTAERELWRCILHNVNRITKTHTYTPVSTKASGRQLVVWLRDEVML